MRVKPCASAVRPRNLTKKSAHGESAAKACSDIWWGVVYASSNKNVILHKDFRMARYQHLSPAFLAGTVGRLGGVVGELRYQDLTAQKS